MQFTRALTWGVALAFVPASAHAATEVSTTDRLKDRRAAVAGARAYSTSFQDGRFYANGWHITGEMGGIWSPPLKLADGIWFGIDDAWVGPATRFTSGRGYARYTFAPTAGLRLARTDFVPDGRRAALFGLSLANPSQTAKTVTVKVDVHSELMGAYPWTGSQGHPTAADNMTDIAAYLDGRLQFTDKGALPGAQAHDYAALVGSTRAPEAGETGAGFRGPQPGNVCQAGSEVAPSACDDGPHGKGVGGQLRYRVTIGARGVETVWIAVAGSDRGLEEARRELTAALQDPDAQLEAKREQRNELAARSRVDLPGDRRLQEAVDWGKQNLADLTQTATDLKVRFVDQGKVYPEEPEGTIRRATFFGAGFPDYPWLFATDGEYTAFPAVALGQFETAEAHLRGIRAVSDLLNDRSGKVAHEIVTDGSVYFGADKDPGNTDESVKFPSAVALVWRWTGDNAFRDNMYDFSKRTLRYVTDELDADNDGWPEGLGNVERSGMGEEKLDNAVYYIRGLYDLADMARSKRDRTTERWATRIADRARRSFDSTWWDQPSIQYADSLRSNARVQQRHWIGVTPMEAELTIGGRAFPGLAPDERATAALAERETDCFSGAAAFNRGLFHTGCAGGPDGKGERKIFSLTTAIQAVGEGNYGRDQKRYTTANADPMLAPDEMPGALPEILPSPDQNANVDRCWTCRSMFMQAWGHYGTAWPVIHQQLGVRPSLGTGRLELVPQLPAGQTRIGGRNIRLGDGFADVRAQRSGSRYTTTVTVTDVDQLKDLRVGVTLPHGEEVDTVTLDGDRVRVSVSTERKTNRGLEVTVPTPSTGRHVVVVTAA